MPKPENLREYMDMLFKDTCMMLLPLLPFSILMWSQETTSFRFWNDDCQKIVLLTMFRDDTYQVWRSGAPTCSRRGGAVDALS